MGSPDDTSLKVADAYFYILLALNLAYRRNLCSHLACEVR